MFKAWVTERGRVICALGREVMGGNGLLQENLAMKSLVDMEVLYTYEGTYDINSLVAGFELTGLKAFTWFNSNLKQNIFKYKGQDMHENDYEWIEARLSSFLSQKAF